MKTRFCHCANARVSAWDCDGCPDDSWLYEDHHYEEPPLYPDGHLTALSPEKLIAERDRQNRIHDAAVDRCEEINSPTIETAAARSRLVEDELKRRGLSPWADVPTPLSTQVRAPE